MSLITYNDISYEISTIQMELEGISDDALVDECQHILVGMESEEMDDILVEFFKKGELSKESRKKAEGLYCLAYMELGWEE